MLVVVGYFSRFCEFEIFGPQHPRRLLNVWRRLLQPMVCHCQLPVTSDNEPHFRSDVFERYLEDCGVEHRKITEQIIIINNKCL